MVFERLDTTFQSLFSWMIRSKMVTAGVGGPITGFQSLFSWMIRSKFSRSQYASPSMQVSILVLLDDSLEVNGLYRHYNSPYVSILVLLDDSLEDDRSLNP